MMQDIDPLDKRILEELQKNCKITVAELARRLGKPRTTVNDRIQRLERKGVIKGYKAIVDPSKLGYKFLAFVMIKARRGISSEGTSSQERLIRKIINDTNNDPSMPFIQEAHIITGAYDIILKVWAKKWDELTNFLIRYLSTMPEVEYTETFLVLLQVESGERGFPLR